VRYRVERSKYFGGGTKVLYLKMADVLRRDRIQTENIARFASKYIGWG